MPHNSDDANPTEMQERRSLPKAEQHGDLYLHAKSVVIKSPQVGVPRKHAALHGSCVVHAEVVHAEALIEPRREIKAVQRPSEQQDPCMLRLCMPRHTDGTEDGDQCSSVTGDHPSNRIQKYIRAAQLWA